MQGGSDVLIVKGLMTVLMSVYSGATPEEILAASPSFLKDLGFEGNLSPSRANGLFAMIKQIQMFAMASHSQGTVSDIERNRKVPTMRTFMLLLSILDFDLKLHARSRQKNPYEGLF
jgi:hypothetical protein